MKAVLVIDMPDDVSLDEWYAVATFANNRQAFIFEKYLERFLGETE